LCKLVICYRCCRN